MADIRIFSYLPNPRVFKSTVTARLNGVSIELVGAKPAELADWLWDFDARPLTDEDRSDKAQIKTAKTGFSGQLHKTNAFLKAHPYGTVPAAFSSDGSTGIFESNSIMRAVARLGLDDSKLYGSNAVEASRIDSFLDTALLFARDSQIYLLAIGDRSITETVQEEMLAASRKYLEGIEQALKTSRFIAGGDLTIADICFVCELSLFSRERAAFRVLEKISCQPLWPVLEAEYTNCFQHFATLIENPAVKQDLGPYLDQVEEDVQARLQD